MLIKNRILKNYKHNKKIVKNWPTEAVRIYDQDIPEFPFIIDLLGTHIVIYNLSKDFDLVKDSKKENLSKVKTAVKDIFNIAEDNIHIKERKKQKGSNQYTRLSKKSVISTLKEYNLKFELNLTDYLDTGLFLDHRIMRKNIFQLSSEKTFLNLFSYTCSVSVFAAAGGASTTNVDLSSTYLEWGKRNFSLNNIDTTLTNTKQKHEFIAMDVIKFLKDHTKGYDLIFLDPPTFSNSKKTTTDFEIEKNQIDLINRSMNILNSQGILFFSTNKRNFQLDQQIKDHYLVKDICYQTIPPDFRNKKIHYCWEIRHKLL